MSRMSEERTALLERLREIFERRDRANMRPTIDEFRAVLEQHPDDPDVLYEVGGAYDTDGQEAIAAGYYERALAAGLSGEALQRCLLQYGSTLRNLDRSATRSASLPRHNKSSRRLNHFGSLRR
jgi:Tetratrico peptide repeat